MGSANFLHKHNLTTGVYTCPANAHYSWPKAGTLLGLGSDALIEIPLSDKFRQAIDDEDRNLDGDGKWDRKSKLIKSIMEFAWEGTIKTIDTKPCSLFFLALESELLRLIEETKHVYSVTAVIGSTEESAVDNIKKVHELRERIKSKVRK